MGRRWNNVMWSLVEPFHSQTWQGQTPSGKSESGYRTDFDPVFFQMEEKKTHTHTHAWTSRTFLVAADMNVGCKIGARRLRKQTRTLHDLRSDICRKCVTPLKKKEILIYLNIVLITQVLEAYWAHWWSSYWPAYRDNRVTCISLPL